MAPTTLTGYGGVGEIGGNAFRLSDGKSDLWLDFGKRFGTDHLVERNGLRPGWNDYYDQYLKPRSFRYIQDLVALGLIPDRLDLYREDLGGARGDGLPAAVIVSHAHQDHCGLIGLLRPDIPIVTTATSKAILQSIERTGGYDPEGEFLEPRMKGKLGRTKDGALSARPAYKTGPSRPFQTPEGLGWSIEGHPVDHSIPGAAGYVVSWTNGSLAYTGDFRLHGRGRQLSERFIQRIAQVDYLVSEGTNVHGSADGGGHGHSHKSTDNEATVEARIEEEVRRADSKPGTGFAGIGYPPRDLDRFQSILLAARRLGRRFVITTKQAHLLKTMQAAGADVPDPFQPSSGICVYLDAGGRGTILHQGKGVVPVAGPDLRVTDQTVSDAEYERLLMLDYPDWEAPIVEAARKAGNAVSARDVAGDANHYLFSINFWSIKELFDIFPEKSAANGLYIHSSTQPFNDDMESSNRKLNRWLRAFNLQRADTHVSGHLGQADLEWALDEIRPRHLIPVHSQHPDITASRYEARTGQKAILPAYNTPVALD